MIKKLILLLSLFCCTTAHAAEMVNVEYIHKLIARDWGIDIQYNPALTNPKVAANMKYLLATVDKVNEFLNRASTTEYADGEYATLYAADTVATNDAVARLINIEPKFFVTTTSDTDSFSFYISARGTYLIDWGDGTRERVIHPDTSPQTHSHTYSVPKEYTIGIGGRATYYNTSWYTGAISFAGNESVAGIDGSLGAVFGTIGDGSAVWQQPRFYKTFARCTNLKSRIPDQLFNGIFGQADGMMFGFTFQYTGVTGAIPKNLFSGMTGQFAWQEYYHTFEGCRGLTGQIPQNLFAGESGGSGGLFEATFRLCSGLTGIPENLFGRVSAEPRQWEFFATFDGCTGLTGIPENLFGDLNGDLGQEAFNATFGRCTGLTGQSAKINGKYLYEIWPDAGFTGAGGCYYGATGLSDYGNIPSVWKDVPGNSPAQN